MTNPAPCTLVVPCFNEAARLDAQAFLGMLEARPGLSLLFVDDGSTDGTRAALEEMRAKEPSRIRVMHLEANRGKAEAVRLGMRHAVGRDFSPGDSGAAPAAPIVGYYDADLATPPGEMLEIIRQLEASGAEAAIGSRVALLGRRIERRAARHYLGRVFATLASAALRLPVYDTQCGAKAFRASPALDAALAEPFISRWAFDVEIIGRLASARPASSNADGPWIIEVPLREWRDVGASKLRLGGMARMALDLVRIARDLRRRHPK